MGAVYRGEQISLKRTCAVKLLRPELGNNPQVSQRFNAEAQAVARLGHPNTVNIYDFGHDTDGTLFIAMEYIEGRSLREAIQKEGPFSVQRALAIALQVSASLSDAHAQGIVHRDLKPDNVMLQQRGKQKDVVRVLDFGIAKLRDEGRSTQAAMTQAGDMLGTPQYMAPEQIKGETVDGRTDVYALGCMIYEMVTARLPYEAPTIMAMLSKHLVEDPVAPTQRRPDLNLPPSVDQLVLHAMQKEPKDRPPTMDAFSDMLGALFGQLPPDPNVTNRSGAMSLQHGAVPGPAHTPPPQMGYAPTGFAPSTPPPPGPSSAYHPAAATPAFAPPMGPPPAFAPPMGPPPGVPYTPAHGQPIAPTAQIQGYAPPMTPPTAMPAPAKSRAPLFVVLGILLLGGAGAAAFVLTRKSDSGKGQGSAVADPTTTGSDDPWASKDGDTPSIHIPDQPEPKRPPKQPIVDPDDLDIADPDEPDDPDDSDLPVPESIQRSNTTTTASMSTIPKGAYITPPSGFTKLSETPQGIGYMHTSTGEMILMMPLPGVTTDASTFAKQYASATNVTLVEQRTVMSAGKSRPALIFGGETGAGKVVQVFVLYYGDTYRFGVLYTLTEAAANALGDMDALEKKLEAFFRSGVHVP